MKPTDLASFPIHLGLGATAEIEPRFTGAMEWYEDYSKRHVADGAEGRLVTISTFSEPWSMWEMHPSGSELVLCSAGSITLHQEGQDASVSLVTLGPGEYVVNAPGVWHTADVQSEATVIFITAGMGTQHRPR